MLHANYFLVACDTCNYIKQVGKKDFFTNVYVED
jgi:hypothetical protein